MSDAAPTLFDLPQARAARDAGIAVAGGNAPPDWKAQALAALERVARRQAELICDDVWRELDGVSLPREKRALGAVTLEAVRRGWITRTGRFVPSAQVRNHANPRRVFSSNLYGKSNRGP